MSRGPVEFVVVDFPGEVPGATLAPQLRSLVDQGVINVIDMLFIARDDDGTVRSFELGDREGEDDFEALDVVVQEIDGLIGEQDVADIGAGLAPGHTAAVFLFEHTWVRDIGRTVSSAGGEVVLVERVPAPVVSAVGALRAG
ncbi:hypothetical protein GCM10009682_43260 [Luedemannella flava]|uniref:DUF1269 domain-containing protein n=1 Tax=Luedemannella flava TaxID=349316 RepID=A0ABP4YN75_9ACTN